MSGQNDDLGGIALLLHRTVEYALACLADTPRGAPGSSGVYHTAPPADCCDSISVWLERIAPGGGQVPAPASFPNEFSGLAKCGMYPIAHLGLRLWRPCWPILEDNAFNPFPPVEATDATAIELAMDAMALFCCIMGDLQLDDGTSIIKGGTAGIDINASMGPITPLRPQGGCAGWDIRFRIELDPCCFDPLA